MMESLKSFIPFWNFFSGLPSKYQVGYLLLISFFVFIFTFYTIFCLNLKYKVWFEIRSNFDNTIIQKPVTILLNHAKRSRNFDTSSGQHVGSYFPGDYELSVMPDEFYKLVDPEKITVTKYNEEIADPVLIYLNSTQPFSDPNDLETEGIEPSAPTLIQTAPEEITLYTIIKSLQASGNRPLEGLTIGNFSVSERYDGNTKEAEILGLKALQSSSLNIILVVDVSGSMIDHVAQVQSAIKKFIQEIQTIGDRDSSSGKIAVLLARGDSISSNNFLKPHGQPIWLSFNDQNLNYLVDGLSQFGAEGNTPLYDALDLAIQQLTNFDESAYNVVVCLSDGEDNRSRNSIESILSIVQKSQVPIFSIAYSDTAQSSLKLRQLIDISRESGAGDENTGSFINTNIERLGELFNNIANSIEKAYELSWRTEANVGDDVDVTIRINYQGRKGLFSTEINKSYILKSSPVQSVK